MQLCTLTPLRSELIAVHIIIEGTFYGCDFTHDLMISYDVHFDVVNAVVRGNRLQHIFMNPDIVGTQVWLLVVKRFQNTISWKDPVGMQKRRFPVALAHYALSVLVSEGRLTLKSR